MTWLKFYTNEEDLYPEEKNYKLTEWAAEIILYKLARHFKVRLDKVEFYGNNGGTAYLEIAKIRLDHNPNMLEVCHELAHLYNYQYYRGKRHNKKLMKIIGKMVTYCRKKDYWKAEIDRRVYGQRSLSKT